MKDAYRALGELLFAYYDHIDCEFNWNDIKQGNICTDTAEDIIGYAKSLIRVAEAIQELEHAQDTLENKDAKDNETSKISLDDVKKFAEWQMDTQSKLGAAIVDFDDDGIAIVNPWVDCTGRYNLSNKEAIREYGVENYTDFISRAIQAIELQKG